MRLTGPNYIREKRLRKRFALTKEEGEGARYADFRGSTAEKKRGRGRTYGKVSDLNG